MKFVSWNVNGLRACIQKGFLDVFNEMNADFFCLQETKLSEGQLQLDMPGYEQYWCYAEKKGYSGTAIFTKHTPLSVTYGIGAPELDNEGRVITLEYKEFFLVTCYTPNAQRELARIDHRMKWDDAFRAYLQSLDAQKPVVLCGDLNVAHQEIDLKNPAANRGNAGFSDQERESFQKTLDLGFTDTFRHLHPGETGRYSWWSYMFKARENNAGWRIDYFLISDRLQGDLYRADIHSSVLGSDHCPVSVNLDTLVNGGIWSPDAGPAKVIEPEPKPKKQTKASASNAKALAAFGGIVAVLLLAVLLWQPVSALFTPVGNIPSVNFFSFPVTVYDKPLGMAISLFSSSSDFEYYPEYGLNYDYDIQIVPTTSSIRISDGENNYFVDFTDFSAMLDYNFWLRVDIPDELIGTETEWTLKLASTDSSEIGLIQAYRVVPYYGDSAMEYQQGWFVTGEIKDDASVTLTISAPDYPLNAHVLTLKPYLTYSEACRLTAQELLDYINAHDTIRNNMTGYVFDPLSSFSFDGYVDKTFSKLSASYPVLTAFLEKPNVIATLMDSDYEVAYYFLYATAFRDLMTPEEGARLVTGHYSSCPYGVLYEDPDLIYDGMTTGELLKNLIDYPWCNYMASISTETAVWVYEYERTNYRLFQELESREDIIDTLLNSTILADTSYAVLPTVLLSHEVYRAKMTPQQEGQFLSGCYPSSNSADTEITNTDIENMTTAAVLDCMLYYNDTKEKLLDCSCQEAMYFYCQFSQGVNLYMDELRTREDAYELLQQKASTIIYGGSNLIYQELYSLWPYLESGVYAMTTTELIDYVFSIPDVVVYFAGEGENTVDVQVTLNLLLDRSDAVQALMDYPLPEDERLIYAPMQLLRQVYDSFTPYQKALYQLNRFNSSPYESEDCSFDLPHPESMTTRELVEALSVQYGLLDELCAFGDTEVQTELYWLLQPDSNVLQELETRTDAAAEVEAGIADGRFIQFYMEPLLRIWESLQSDSVELD